MQLEDGKILVICGEAGSGKRLKAREIASQNGTYAVAFASALKGRFGLGGALADSPDVKAPKLIVVSNAPDWPKAAEGDRRFMIMSI
jgi:hypothetical protein